MATGETKTTELTAGTEMAETDSFLVNIGTTTRQATVTVARTILNAADQTFSGAVTADSFTGDGSGLTGITSGTGGITNTGSTTIGADSDIDGVGVVALQTRTITRQTITNDGNIGFNTTDFGSGTGGVIGIANVTTAPSATPTGGGVFYVESGLLKYKGTDGIVKVLSSNEANVFSDFVANNLIINFQSNTTADADADNIIFVDDSGSGARVDSINTTFDITTDLMTSTTEKLSHWYQMWLDSDGIRLLVPDLESTTTVTTTSKLVDSAATFTTDLVQIGDIVFNLTDLTQTTVTAIDSETILSLADDIFTISEDYKIRMLSPVGLGSFKARIGAAFNNSSSNFDDSTYTQIQVEKYYSEAAGDFSSSGSGWTVAGATMSIFQVNDWTGRGFWKDSLNFIGSASSATTLNLTFTGIVSSAGFTQSMAGYVGDGFQASARTSGNSGLIKIQSDALRTSFGASGTIILERKPTFHN